MRRLEQRRNADEDAEGDKNGNENATKSFDCIGHILSPICYLAGMAVT